MNTKTTIYDIITSGYHSQPEYDKMLSNLDISSLKFLNGKYKSDIRAFRENFDLNDEDNQQQYKEMLQRKKMIQEEMRNRIILLYESESYQEGGDWFDPETGIVIDRNSKILYEVAYADEDCSSMVYIMDNESKLKEKQIDDMSNEEDYEMYEPSNRNDRYLKWDYVKFLVEESNEEREV